MAQAIIMIGVAGLVEPMTVISKNRMQLFNEFCMIFLVYHLIPLTDFMANLELRNKFVGNSLISFTLFNLAVNILLALF
jgi:hypothetical protein